MNREIPNASFTPDLQDRFQGARKASSYTALQGAGNETEAWRPELIEDFIARVHVTYPSPHQYANEQASLYVRQHWPQDFGTGSDEQAEHAAYLKETNADDLLMTTLYILNWDQEPHRANVAYSMTLTEALMSNWQQEGNGELWNGLSVLRPYREGGYPSRISDEALIGGECFAYEAIYRRTSPQRFDHSTHIALDPKAFKAFSWEADLQAHYKQALEQFWAEHDEHYYLLIKAALLKSAYVQHDEGSLSAGDKALVLEALGLKADQDWDTLTKVELVHAPMSDAFRVRELILYRYVATDIIVIEHVPTGRLIVYIPGNSSPIHTFADLSALCDWVVAQTKDPRRRVALEGHFRAEDDPDGYFLSGIHTTLAGFAAYPYRLDDRTGHWWPHKEVSLGPAITFSPFSHFKANLKSRLESDATQLIRTRGDAYKQRTAQMLNNAIIATGAVAMIVPELWVPLAVMSAALVGLGAEEIVDARSLDEKKEGVSRVVFGVLNAVPFVIEGTAIARQAFGAAARTGDSVVAGTVDEVGEKVAGLSPKARAEALEKQADQHAQLAQDAHEQSEETLAERQDRLGREELQRKSHRAHREATFDSVMAFGVEPEGLRSLSPESRAELAKFEYHAPLQEGGMWSADEYGAAYSVVDEASGETRHFARVHSRIYPVERIEAAKQYRIFSLDDTSIKGPYIKKTKGYYSDIDLKPGLRGGDSFIEVEPPEGMLEISKPDITLAPGQHAPTVIEIPLDGIEVRQVYDSSDQLIDKYYAMDTPQGTPVRYDADLACWRKNERELLWRNNKGVWKTGSEKEFLKVRKRLDFGVRSEIYAFPRLPGLPAEQEAIEHSIHQIWLGDRLPRAKLIETMKANMRQAPDVNFTLHIDIESNEVELALRPKAQLEAEFADVPNFRVSGLQDEEFFEGFMGEPETHEPYHFFRHGDGQNLAAASDVLRYHLIHEYGGIYLDCDDVLKTSFEGVELKAGQSDVLVGRPISSPRAGFFGPNNSHFASLPGNPVLKEMQRDLYRRFLSERELLTQLKDAVTDPVSGINPYQQKVFEVTGPGFFLDSLKRLRPDYAPLLDESFKLKPGVRSFIFLMFVDELVEFYAPFKFRLPIGAGTENSWIGIA